MGLPVFSVEEIRGIEAEADASGYTFASMMNDAGRAVADRVAALLAGLPGPRVTVLVGKGNNGGDALVAAAALPQLLPGAQIRAYLLDKRENDSLLEAAQSSGVFVSFAEDDHDGRVVKHMSASADLIIDGLFGIGVRLPIRDIPQRVMRYVRQALNERSDARRAMPQIDPTLARQIERPPKQWVLAVDCPSGIDCDTGAADAVAIKADYTLSFIAAKPGLVTFPAAALVGTLLVVPLNLPDTINLDKRARITLLDNETARDWLPDRPLDANKGAFGRVLLVAGSNQMPGAAGLAALAAYRGGVGLVEVAAPSEAVSVLQTHLLEAVWTALPDVGGFIVASALDELKGRLPHADTLVVGPGLGEPSLNGVIVQDLLLFVGKEYAKLPVVLDADALNALAALPDWPRLLPPDSILTPHPGEMARLLKVTTADVQKDRLALTIRAAKEWKAVVVLKGAHSIVASPDGKAAISPFKTDALAKGGTGDVLAGLIGALRSQHMKPFEAAALGVYVHGLAGLMAAGSIGYGAGVLASDVAREIPTAFSRIQAG